MTQHDYARLSLLVQLAAMGRLRLAYRAACADPTTGTRGIDAAITDLCREARIGGPRPMGTP